MTKTEIRKQMKGLNTALSSEQREELSARIFNEAERLPAFARAKVVALFASLKTNPSPPRHSNAGAAPNGSCCPAWKAT